MLKHVNKAVSDNQIIRTNVFVEQFVIGGNKTRNKSPWRSFKLFTDSENVYAKLPNDVNHIQIKNVSVLSQ